MVWEVTTIGNENICFVADKMKIVPNGQGGNLAVFYSNVFDSNSKDKNGHIYANITDEVMAAYYLDNIIGVKRVSGLSDEEFAELNREGIFSSMGYELVDEDEGGEEVAV